MGASESKNKYKHEYLEFLHKVPLFQRLPDDKLEDLVGCCVETHIEAGEVVMQQGDTGNEFYIIRTGKCSVAVNDVVVAQIGDNDFFGENALLHNEPRKATITAITKVDTLKITRSAFQRFRLHEVLYVDFLAKVPLFQRLPKELLPDLASTCEPVHFEQGSTVIKQGDIGNEFFVIKSGMCAIHVDGNMVAQVTENDFFGESALLHNERRTATITALNSVYVLKIIRGEFQRLGLHEKLQFPKRKKINARHKMMAAGAAGVKATPNEARIVTELTGDNIMVERNYRGSVTSMDWKLAERKSQTASSWMKVQLEALQEIFFGDKLNMSAFFFVPLGLWCKHAGMNSGIVFLVNFCAIVPMASILGQATEALAFHMGQLIGGLLTATFGNAVEMIMCFQAVKLGLIDVVQGNLLGSILSNLLLVLGMAIFASGVVRHSQEFNAQGAAANMTCQLVASISVCLPTCFASISEQATDDVLQISRICSLFLIIVYGMFLVFMLHSHADLFAEDQGEQGDGDELSPMMSTLLLFLCTLVVFFCSECLVDSIDEVSEKYGLSKAFIGVILLPIVGNAAEHSTAVTSAYKGMMDLALGVAVGSSTQISLFVVPCAVVAGYFYNQPMNLNFTVFDTTCQMLTVFLVSQVLQHGSTNWLHGAMLMAVYCTIAVMTLFITTTGEQAE